MNIDYILSAHGFGGGAGSQPMPNIEGFTVNTNDEGTELRLNWTNPDILEFTGVELYMDKQDISNLTYKQITEKLEPIATGDINSYTVKDLKHGDTRYFKIFGIFMVIGEEETNSGVSVIGEVIDTVPPKPISNMIIMPEKESIRLSWDNPKDIDLKEVVIIYDTKPINSMNDGVIIYRGLNNSIEITNLEENVEYHIRVFTIDNAGNTNNDESMQYITQTSNAPIYGFEIDEDNFNPETAVTYIGDAVGMKPAKGGNRDADLGDWEEFVYSITQPILLDNGVEKYKIKHSDYNKKTDGSNATLTGEDGDVMVRFPHFYVKEEYSNGVKRVLLSRDKFDGYNWSTEDVENGYGLFLFKEITILQYIFTLIFKSRDYIESLGAGRKDTSKARTGITNKVGFCFGESDSNVQRIKFLGIEDFYGNLQTLIHGLVFDLNSGEIKVTDFPQRDGFAKYKTLSKPYVPSNGLSYWFGQTVNNIGFIPSNYGGSGSRGYRSAVQFKVKEENSTNQYWTLYNGHGHNDKLMTGGLYGMKTGYSDLSSQTGDFDSGYRLSYKNDKWFYIGVYHGVRRNNRVRSISGVTPENSVNYATLKNTIKNME